MRWHSRLTIFATARRNRTSQNEMPNGLPQHLPELVFHPLVFFAGLLLAIIILVDAFEAIILPRRVTRRIRLARLYYRSTWWLWKKSPYESKTAKPAKRSWEFTGRSRYWR